MMLLIITMNKSGHSLYIDMILSDAFCFGAERCKIPMPLHKLMLSDIEDCT